MAQTFLFVHQNFPGQFLHVARTLAAAGATVVALGIKGRPVDGVRFLRYASRLPTAPSQVPLARDTEIKIARGAACARAMAKLKAEGLEPDVVVAHPGWGEALFCKDIWPRARLVVYAEYFYNTQDSDWDFDPQFSEDTPLARARLRLKNTVHLHALASADTAYAPTRWQRDQLPQPWRDRCDVMFDGIDTETVRPDAGASIALQQAQLRLSAGDEVLTFVNRNLEPYRGFHVFMRALPRILERRPGAHCLIVGRDDVSYGRPPPGGGTWRERMLKEVGERLPRDRVHFLGGLPYAAYLRVLQVSRCHVYMTYPFVLSWSCLEAMSAGCTVVASATPPVREVIDDGEQGLLFDFFDEDALVERAVSVLAQPAAHARLARAAHARVVERYDLERVCLPGQLAIIRG